MGKSGSNPASSCSRGARRTWLRWQLPAESDAPNVGPLVGTAQRVTNFLVIPMIVRGWLIRQSPLPWSSRQRYKHQLWQRRFFKMRACSSGNFPPSPALPCGGPCPQKWANLLIFRNMWCGITATVESSHDRLPGPSACSPFQSSTVMAWPLHLDVCVPRMKNRQRTAHLPRLLDGRRPCPRPRKAPTSASGFPLPLDGPLPPGTAPFGSVSP